MVQAALCAINSFYTEKGLLHLVIQEENLEGALKLHWQLDLFIFFSKLARRNTDKCVYI